VRRLVIGAALGLLLSFCGAATASATVFNAVVLDGNQDPTDELPDDDYLWAYTTADIAGGIVCVHPAPVRPGDHCNDKGTWAESPVPPATATFTPISAPPLPPGRWQLLAANDADDPDDDATSVEFTVAPCPGSCPVRVDPQRKADFDLARAVVLASVEATCKGLNAVGIYQALRAAQFEVSVVMAFPGGAGGTLSVMWGRAVQGAEIGVKTAARLVGPTKLGKHAYLSWAAWFACQSYDLAKKLSQGKSRARGAHAALAAAPDYEVIPPTDFLTLPTLDEAPVDDLGIDLAGIQGNMDAVELGWDRMVAAGEAGADDWEHAQARALGAAGLELVRHLRRAGASLRHFADVAAADPDVPDPLVTQADIDEAEDLRQRVRDSGFTAEEIADLKSQGGTDADVEALRTIVTRDVSDGPIGKSLPEVLRDEAQSYEDMIGPADALGREAAAVAGRTNQPPHAAFDFTPVSGPAPQETTFTSAAEDPDHDPLTVAWDFGDGTTGTGSTPSHTYEADGDYTVTQTVSDGYATDSTTRTVTVGAGNLAPTAAFDAQPSSGEVPLDVTFDASASSDFDGSVVSYDWDFGDGGTGSGATISHTYSSAGSYTATLTVTDDDGATATATQSIEVVPGNSPPTASFTTTPSSGTVPLAVAFDASASSDLDGSVASYAWDFGDGSQAIGSAPSHTYTAAGIYTVTLTVTDDGGAAAQATDTVSVTDPENQAPTAVIDATPTSGTAPLDVDFDGSGSSDPDGDLASYSWDFGDGGTAQGVAPQHTYTQAGTFTATLTVIDDGGAAATDTETITVSEPDNVPPTAAFSVTPDGGVAPVDVTFDASGSSDSDGSVTSYEWDFGDGQSGSGLTALHTFTTAGSYTVTLTVTDDDGATDVETRTLAVAAPNAPPTASFTATPDSGSAPLQVSFDASASGDPDGSIVSYAWDFGDGGSGSGKSPGHGYDHAGDFAVALTVTDDDGATATASKLIHVSAENHAPEAQDDQLAVEGAGTLDALLNDSDPDGDVLSLVSAGTAQHGSVSCSAKGACLYTPEADFAGSDHFTYTVRDPHGLEATATVTLDVVHATGEATLAARDDEASTRSGTPVTIHVLANDSGRGLSVTEAGDPQHGSVDCDPDGACRYEPEAGFSGSDGFSYSVQDDSGNTGRADVHLTVAPAGAGFAVGVSGQETPAGKASLTQGRDARWSAGVTPSPSDASEQALAAAPRPAITSTLTGPHAIKAGSVRSARGWSVDPVAPNAREIHARAGEDAQLGQVSDAIPRPRPGVSQGSGGDGHVPILVGSRVYAFFHHSHPTSVSCVDRRTGALCPGYPKPLTMSTSDIPGPGVVVGSRIYVHLIPEGVTPQRAPQSLFCWDTAKAQTCGLIVVDRVAAPSADASAPVLVGAKLYFGGDGGRLYCVDPSTNAACAVASFPTGLDQQGSGHYDIVSHGTRVFLSQSSGGVACIDVAAKTSCPGWSLPRQLAGWNVVNHHNASGAADGVCAINGSQGECITDANPGTTIPLSGWPSMETYYTVTQEAEAGTRTMMASTGPGLGCWDWVTSAACAGGGWDVNGWSGTDTDGQYLPGAYGVTWDGSCAVALGDPGLVFTVDFDGKAPCNTLGAGTDPRTIDLRDQRCDGTVGAAGWQQVALADAAGGELAAAVVIIRDATTHDVLATKDITTGALSLAGIDPTAHPAITVEASAISAKGDEAWRDAIPPRIRVRWKSDPKQLCFETTTTPDCASPLDPISVRAQLDGTDAKDEKTLALQRAACPPELGALPDRSVPEQTPLDAAVSASDPNGGPLVYSLVKAPAGMTIDGATGRLSWTPTEAQGPGAYEVTVKVADAGGLSAKGTFTARATEVNRPPALAPLGDVAVGTGTAFAGRAAASDPDLPANRLAYALVNPPAGASIDATSGAIAWPAVPDGAHALRVRVTDNGSPPLSAERTFTITGTDESSAADLVRACTSRGVVLEDVVPSGSRVRLLGVADKRFAGRRVSLVFSATGKVVARPRVKPDGSFSATAPMPPRRIRNSNRARYQARVGGERSLNLKLTRRMLVTSLRVRGGKVTITGKVVGPLARRAKDREIVLEQRVTCTKLVTVSRFQPRPSGAFAVTVRAPAGASAAVYRLRTKVRASTHSSRLGSTFTLPRAIGFR
jgi:PKD repeat protein